MGFILDISLCVRLLSLFILGGILGGQINRGIYRLAVINPRQIGPWSRPDAKAPGRRWFDRLPIVGWFGLRREEPIHGRGFWVRPLLIELFTAIGFAWLYYWEINGGLLPAGAVAADHQTPLHVHYLLHITLISLMMVATFIDFDEQIIPDSITVPGALIALCFAVVPYSRLPILDRVDLLERPEVGYLTVSLPDTGALAIAIACFVGSCLALLPTLWCFKDGFRKAILYFIAHLIRPRRKTKRPEGAKPRRPFPVVILYFLLLVFGTVVIILFWQFADTEAQKGLFSALIGMAFGGGLVWTVRILGTLALQKEAMGFGDVTLMAMIGAFLGWEAALIVFFLAPFAALMIAVGQLIFIRRTDIAFGPYLCLAAVFLILGWHTIWNLRADDIFKMGWLVPGMVAVCLALMGIMLLAWRHIKELLFRDRE